ncbi:hypothetical protein [Chitinophaga tropicalis]|nr:hypothetical protein [Chitinophaga tropicalis]
MGYQDNTSLAARKSAAASMRYQRLNDRASEKLMLRLKQGVWLYFLLLVFEGALRKWFLPFLASPLLLAREPVALWLIIITWHRGMIRPSNYMTLMVITGVISLIAAVTVGHGNLFVALYGARILLIHFPLMFVIASIFTKEDILQLGKATVIIAIPMAILITLQFNSPQSAWVNRGVGGDMEGAGFSGAMGYFRPPGTFSFTNGTTLFFSFAASFIFYFWLKNEGIIKRWILIAATCALIFAIPVAISRALLFQVIITVLFLAFAGSSNPEYVGKLIAAAVGLVLVMVILSQTSMFSAATEVFMSRFTDANESEGGLEGVFLDRFLGGMITALTSSSEMPFFGYGLGMGTNVGAMLLSGNRTFLIAEEEWARTIGELGPILGLGVIFIRVGLAFNMLTRSLRKLRGGDALPWMLLSAGFLLVAQGGWSQPTALGFSAFTGALILAALRDND